MFKKLLDKIANNKMQRSVGRPKLADEATKKDAKVTLGLAIALFAMFFLTGATIITGKNPIEMLKISNSQKLKGGIDGSVKYKDPTTYTFNCGGAAIGSYTVWYATGNSASGGFQLDRLDSAGNAKWAKSAIIEAQHQAGTGGKVKSASYNIKNNLTGKTLCSGDYTLSKPETYANVVVRLTLNKGSYDITYKGSLVYAGKLSARGYNTVTQSDNRRLIIDNDGATINSVTLTKSNSSEYLNMTVNITDPGEQRGKIYYTLYTYNTSTNKVGTKLTYKTELYNVASNKNVSKSIILNGAGSYKLEMAVQDDVNNKSAYTERYFTVASSGAVSVFTPGASTTTTKTRTNRVDNTTPDSSSYCLLYPRSISSPGSSVTAKYSISCYGGAKVSSVQYRLDGKYSWTNRPSSKYVTGENSITFTSKSNHPLYMRVCWASNSKCSAESYLGVVNTDGTATSPGTGGGWSADPTTTKALTNTGRFATAGFIPSGGPNKTWTRAWRVQATLNGSGYSVYNVRCTNNSGSQTYLKSNGTFVISGNVRTSDFSMDRLDGCYIEGADKSGNVQARMYIAW